MRTLLFIFLISFSSLGFAQTRYLEEVFTEADMTIIKDVHYSRNIGIFDKEGFTLFNSQDGVSYRPQDLFFDVYMPSIKDGKDSGVDTVVDRPVVIITHGGLFKQYITRCYGAKDDLATVDLAKKLAKMGYVVIAPQMRLGLSLIHI